MQADMATAPPIQWMASDLAKYDDMPPVLVTQRPRWFNCDASIRGMHIFDAKGLLIACAIFLPMERVSPLRPDQRIFRRHFLTDLIYALVNGILIKAGIALIIAAAMVSLGLIVPAALKTLIAAQPTWLQLVEVILIADLGFYCAHRAFHTVPLLWRFHAIHHSIEELDWLAAHRVHPVDQALTKAFSLIPVMLLGYSQTAVALFALIYQVQAFLLHANVRIDFGTLKWVIASPQFHHWHHAHERAAHNKNFAGQLSFLDAMFGTIHLPGSMVPERYGVDDPISGNYIGHLAYPFRRR